MTAAEVVQQLRSREGALRELGIAGLSIFGSVARGEQRVGSDVDLAVTLDHDRFRQHGAWHYFGLQDEVAAMLGVSVDLVAEPARRARFQAEIDRDRVHVF